MNKPEDKKDGKQPECEWEHGMEKEYCSVCDGIKIGYNKANSDWDTYLTDLLAPLKEVWCRYGHCIHVLTDETFSDSIADKADIDMWKTIKQLAERLNW